MVKNYIFYIKLIMKFFSHFRCNIPQKYQHEIENLDNDKFYEKYRDVILSCYFNGKNDPIHHEELNEKKQPSDNYNYIKPLYETVKKNNLHLIIFHDCLSPEFIKKYQTDKIIFRKTSLVSKLSINDERFIIYYEYLKNKPYRNVLSSDISDVYINKNPFDLIKNYDKRDEKLVEEIEKLDLLNKDELKEPILENKTLKHFMNYNSTYITNKELKFIFNNIVHKHSKEKYKIFIGTNSLNYQEYEKIPPWFERRMKKFKCFNFMLNTVDRFPLFKIGDYQIYNPGTIMANYYSYMCFIRQMIEVLIVLTKYKEGDNWNMMIATYLVTTFLMEDYNPKNACSRYIYTGYPFNSLYKRREILGKSPNCLIHK